MAPSTARRRKAAPEDGEQTPPSTPPRASHSKGRIGKLKSKSPINRAVQLVKTRITLYRPKFPIFSSAFVLAIIFIIAPYVDKTYHKISEEGRVASDLGDVGFDLGKFSVQVSRVTIEDDPLFYWLFAPFLLLCSGKTPSKRSKSRTKKTSFASASICVQSQKRGHPSRRDHF